jgi:hypothetical protein
MFSQGNTSHHSIGGIVMNEKEFKFDCGFTIPLNQIAWCTDTPLEKGLRLTFSMTNVKVTKHEHRFTCICGAVKGN